MKNSIAKKVTRKVSAILIIALAVLFVASFWLVQRVVYNKTRSYARAVATVYIDLITYESDRQNKPISTDNAEMILQHGDYICKWYDVDFAYVFIPDTQTGKIKYLCVSQNEKFNKINPDDKYIGKIADYTLTKEELEVWCGNRLFSHSVTKSKTGHELSTMIRIKDRFGNKIMAGVDQSYKDVYLEIIGIFSILALIIILVILGVYFTVYMVIKRLVSKPAEVLSKNMTEFITDGNHTAITLDESGSDEYSMIASAFNCMTQNINSYINNINTLTREQEHQKTELDIAAKIQKGLLPKEHLNSDFYEVRTTMIPAKDVGGDFYCYLPLDDERVFVVIADVSGKGVSAALYMAVTLTLTVQYAKMNLSPAEILEKTNEALSQNNSQMLFATEFVGIYNSTSQEFTYSNAGHNLPYVISKDGITVLDKAKGSLLGLFTDEKYTQATTRLEVGDTIFLYTDGVTESTDSQKNFFGDARLKDVLKKFRQSHAYNAISFINDKLSEFSNGSEQYDDITMLTLNVKKTTTLLLDVDVAEFEKIKEAILSLPVSRPQQLKLCLCAEEWFVNICSYAFPDGVPDGEKIEFVLTLSDRVRMQFSDGGQPFNPLEHIVDIENYDIETQVGGLGNFIAVSNTDDSFYRYENGKNVLTLIKFIEE